ncbi:hypothetical protein ACSMX9_20890 [Streptomyces sp. LE64]|uniref:hypothetical protein n=1 Tax=Streptomyces sp. LE64 TaxID=3448653 RepID=UPI004042A34F
MLSDANPDTGALLLCRAAPETVTAAARLLREPFRCVAAGDGWTALVPGTAPWGDGGDPVERVVAGWAGALAVGGQWAVVALWWDPDHSGFLLASGFRRPVGFAWLAAGTPVGEDEAVHTFALRLGLDPVLDVQALEELARPDSAADARARLIGLVAVLARTGVVLPPGLAPGAPLAELWALAARYEVAAAHGWALPVRALSMAQLALGVPMTAWGLRTRRGPWVAAGAVLLASGALGLRRTR